MLRAIIVDDEKMPIEQLSRAVAAFDYIEIIDKVTRPLMAIEVIKEKKPDIVFLDIEMPQINGLEFAQNLLDIDVELEIIFVTAYNHYALEAFEVSAIGYLLKPIRKDKLEKVLERVLKIRGENIKDHISVQEDLSYSIQCLGRLDIIKHGEPLEITFRTAKAKELFAYYIHNRKRMISRDELLNMFWSDMSYERALANFNTTNYQLKRRILKSTEGRINIAYQSGYYRLVLESVVCDVDMIENQLFGNPLCFDQNQAMWLEVIERYGNTYFEGIDSVWVEDERYVLSQRYIIQLKKMIKHLYEMGDYIHCVEQCRRLIRKEEEDEEILQILSNALQCTDDTLLDEN
ncbi:MAG: response regulator [Clostridia bacterium]|nr:response regulator [Clostridia bacterium]